MLLQFLANGLCAGAVYALVALGFGLIYSSTRVFHLAHGGVYAASAYTLYFALEFLHLPVIPAVLVALAAAASLGGMAELLVYRPLYASAASSAVVLVSSLGLYIVMVNLIALVAGNSVIILRPGVETTIMVMGVVLTRIQVAQLIVGGAAISGYAVFLLRTRAGTLFRALADNSPLLSVLGTRVHHLRLAVFVLGSALAGLGAALAALDVGIDPHAGLPAVLVAAVACIIGGVDRLLAPAAGAVLLGVLQSLVTWQTSASWQTAVTFGLLILFLLFRPTGLAGGVRRLEER